MAKKKKNQNPVPLKYQKNCIIYTRISDPNKQTEKIMDAEAIEALQTSKPHRNPNHNPNVTMINCNRKPTE